MCVYIHGFHFCVVCVLSGFKAEEAMLRVCRLRVGMAIPKLSELSIIPSLFSFSFTSHSHSQMHTFSSTKTFHFHSPSSLPLSPFTFIMSPYATSTHFLQIPLFIFHFCFLVNLLLPKD